MTARNDPPVLFSMAGKLAQIVTPSDGTRASLLIIDEEAFRNRLDNVATFVETYETVRGHKRVEVDPPKSVARSIMALPEFPSDMAAPIERIIYTPQFAAGGRYVDTPGYDRESRLYYHRDPNRDLGEIPGSPTWVEVVEAVRFLVGEYLVDFPFDDQSSRANALACMLLPFVRALIDGATPIHSFESATEGTGKTRLAQACAFPSRGLPVPTDSQSEDDAEYRKNITSSLMSGEIHILIDNINNPFLRSGESIQVNSGVLSKAVTDLIWNDRLLGLNKKVSIPVRVVWMATGNNINWSRELSRRIVPIRIIPLTENPSERRGHSTPATSRSNDGRTPIISGSCGRA